MLKNIGFLALLLIVSACGRSGDIKAQPGECANAPAGKIIAANPWMRATSDAGATSAVYFTLCNQLGREVSLVCVETALAQASLHQTTRSKDGVVSMSPRERVPVPAGESVSFEPGGLHVMLTGVTAPIGEGETVSLTLKFDDGSEIEAEANAVALNSKPHGG